jgi:hypothetical protein
MIVITTPLGVAGLLAISYLSLLFAYFSRRLSAVTRMANYHRWFSVASVLIILAAMSQAMRSTAALAPDLAPPILVNEMEPWFSLVSFHIPLAIGITIDLVLVWHYWGWILKEKVK